MPEDWRERFIRAYDTEFQEWIDAAAHGRVDRAVVVGRLRGHGGVRRRPARPWTSGERVEMSLREQPDLYKTTAARTD